jgi:hypothetical protein
MGIKSLGKNPVSGFGAGVKETGFFKVFIVIESFDPSTPLRERL